MKSNSLSNIDITNILRAQGIEINGIFMKDELPKKLKKGDGLATPNFHRCYGFVTVAVER
jgi:hypothetical protein